MKIINTNYSLSKRALSVGTSTLTNAKVALTEQSNLFDQLIEIINELDILVIAFQNDDIDYVISKMTLSYFNYISQKLFDAKRQRNKYLQYEIFRTNINQTLYMLFRAMSVEIGCASVQRELEIYKRDSNILRDPIKLESFINSLRQQRSLFGNDMKITGSVSASVNPEYREYFRLYGIPPDMVFDPQKLAEIKARI
jgi:hypothetical protein